MQRKEWINEWVVKKILKWRDAKNKYRIQPVFCSLQGESVAEKNQQNSFDITSTLSLFQLIKLNL